MNIIITQNYVAGIFADATDAQRYLALKPPSVSGFVHINDDLQYPFYLLELDGGRFLGFHSEAEARAYPGGLVLFTITKDYQPENIWIDEMGSLPHVHLTRDWD